MSSSTRIRLDPGERRDQLLDLGVRLLATRSIDEMSIDLLADEAGVSRGLLYHYFGSKRAFHEAVVQRAADELVARTEPPSHGDERQRLAASVDAYVAYVEQNHSGYLSLVRGGASGDEALHAIHESTRTVMTERIFVVDRARMAAGETPSLPDTPTMRLLARGWVALVEESVLSWMADPDGVSRRQLVDVLTDALPTLATLAT